jgi:predicted nucleic acid-binding protein
MPRGLLDTSILIAQESGRALDRSRIPIETATTVITLAELQAGVFAASDAAALARRLSTLELLATIVIHPVDERAALVWAQLRFHLAGTGQRVGVNDLWIAAIAGARGLPVVTQDDDFDPIDGVAGVTVIKV